MQKKWSYLLIVIIFIILLVFANDLVMLLSRNHFGRVIEIPQKSMQETESDLLYKVENATSNQDIYRTVEVRGWAFTPNQGNEVENEFKLLLISDDKSYQIDGVVVERIDLKNLFRENDVVGIQHGFISTFTPLKIRDGNYQLWLYYRQDNNEFYVESEIIMEKAGKDLLIVDLPEN